MIDLISVCGYPLANMARHPKHIGNTLIVQLLPRQMDTLLCPRGLYNQNDAPSLSGHELEFQAVTLSFIIFKRGAL
jgi:hypothetical protein